MIGQSILIYQVLQLINAFALTTAWTDLHKEIKLQPYEKNRQTEDNL